jgi:hypothetical protein
VKVPAKTKAKWEAILKAEGLQPLDSDSEAGRLRRNVQRLARLTETEKDGISIYYTRCEEVLEDLRHLRRPFRVWALHTQGLGRREIARRLRRSEKQVRTELERLHVWAGLVAPSWGGKTL